MGQNDWIILLIRVKARNTIAWDSLNFKTNDLR